MLIKTAFTVPPRSKHTYPLALVEGGWVTYTIPSPLAGLPLRRAQARAARTSQFAVEALALLTLLLSRAHHVDKERTRFDWMDETTRCDVWRCFQRLRRGDIRDVSLSSLIAVAAASGVPRPLSRSNLTWVGGRSPQEAWLVPPPEPVARTLMEDLHAFSQIAAGDACDIWYAEALAYQLTYIHPLADGNGRTIRSLLARLALRRGTIEPLALVWLMVFRKLSLGAAWDATGSEGGRFNHYATWRLAVTPLVDYLTSFADEDEHLQRLILAELCLGKICARRLERLGLYGAGASRKALARARSTGHWTESADALTNNTLRRLLDVAVDAYLARTEVIKTEMILNGSA